MTRSLLNFRLILFLSLTIACFPHLSAQDGPQVVNPPVNFEVMPASEGVFGQLLITKKFLSSPRFGFFSVTNVLSDWDKRMPSDFMHQSALTFQIIKGLDLEAGYHYTPFTGFRPSTGLIYKLHKKDWLLVIVPRIDLLNKDAAYEIFGSLQFQPRLNESLNFYSRIQTLYVMSVNGNEHQRSYLWLRAGLSYKEFAFGPGVNLDYFGPAKENISNYGLFLSVNLF